MKDDERLFLIYLASVRPRQLTNGPFATQVGEKIGIHSKRVEYLLDK